MISTSRRPAAIAQSDALNPKAVKRKPPWKKPAPFSAFLENVQLHQPKIPIISTVTGKLVDAQLMTDKQYWANQIISTVQFAEAMNSLVEMDIQLAIEVGPGNVTSKLLQQRAGKNFVAIGGLDASGSKTGLQAMLQAIGQIWLHGITPNWKQLYEGQLRVKLELPTYAFNRKTYWIEPAILINDNYQEKRVETNVLTELENEAMVQSSGSVLAVRLVKLLEDASGLNLAGINPSSSFIELGLDSDTTSKRIRDLYSSLL